MQTQRIGLAVTVFLLALAGFPAQAQQPKGELPSVAHATSRPLSSYTGTTHPKMPGPARVIPLRRPQKPGGGGPAGAPATGGNWSDIDLQSSYPSSQFTLGKVFQAFSFSGYLPPDENLSVGINSTGGSPQTQIVSVVNTSYRVFDTSGNLLVQGDLASNLFGNFTSSVCSSEDGGDPVALFDKLDQRWIIGQLAYNSTFTDNHYCLAISQTSDATGKYDLYDFRFNSNLPDYPKLAVWSDGIYFSANIFASNGSTLTFSGAKACSFPRSDVTTSPASITFTCSPGTDATVYNILPADLEGTTLPPSGTGPDYYLQFEDNLTSTSGNLLRLYQLNGTTLSVVGNLTVNTFHEACGGGTCIPQEGTTELLDSLGDRLMYRLSYRNYGSYQQMVANQSVQVDSSSQQSGIRWYALRNNPSGLPPFTVYKESTFSPDVSLYRWMGSIAQNKYGDLGLGYSTSGVTSVPGIAVTGLLNGTDTLMEQEERLYNGSNQSYEGTYSRWGDYSSISVDPTDDCSFWYTNEYITPPVLSFDFLWQTVIGKFSFPDCSGSSSPSFSLTPNPGSQTITPGGSASYTLTVASLNSYSNTVDLKYSGCPTGATCSLPASVNVPADSNATATLSVTNTSSVANGTYDISVTATDSTDNTLTKTTSVALTVGPPPDFSLSTSGSPQTVAQGATASFGITVSPLNGFSSGVTLTVTSGCPASPANACSFSPSNTIAGGSGSATLNVATDTTTTPATYTINISASDGGSIIHAATVSLTVSSSQDFSLSTSGSPQTVAQGATASFGIAVSPLNGFSSGVTLTVTSGCPASPANACSFSPSNTIAGGSGSATLNVATDTTTTPATYTINILASDGGSITHAATVSLTVTQASSGDFSLSASPNNLSLKTGQSGSYTVSVSPTGGFNSNVTVTANCPSGFTCSITNNGVIAGGSGSVGDNVGDVSATRRSNFTITFTATGGGQTHQTSVSLRTH